MADLLLPFQPSLAQATGTRVDSNCKHMQQCRVSTDDMMRFVQNEPEELQRNKYRYCIHKDEFVVGIGRPWDSTTMIKRVTNAAYPRVVSNLGALGDSGDTGIALNMIRFMNHYARSVKERQLIIKWFNSDAFVAPAYLNFAGAAAVPVPLVASQAAFENKDGGKMKTKMHMNLMSDYVGVGYASTLGWAHPNTGDTMTAVMIGGLRTVMNGDFEVFAGDQVQWYWGFERDDFHGDGRRKPYLDGWNGDVPGNIDPSVVVSGDKRQKTGITLPDGARIRQANYELQYGQKSEPDHSTTGVRGRKGNQKIVARIKPYFRDDENPRIYDWYRVFGIAISSARPHEMVDIKISRQSI
jgi:hypothetical protein